MYPVEIETPEKKTEIMMNKHRLSNLESEIVLNEEDLSEIERGIEECSYHKVLKM